VAAYEDKHCQAAEDWHKNPANPSPETEDQIEHYLKGLHFDNYEEVKK
jgi:hypothetical protein